MKKQIQKTSGILLSCAALCMLGSGCASMPKPKRMPDAVKYAPPVVEAPVAQKASIESTDNRPDVNAASQAAKGLLVMIPIVPYATQKLSPENFTDIISGNNLEKELRETIAKDLQAAKIVASVNNAAEADAYKIKVNLTEGLWTRKFTTYGLSSFGSLLWYLGIPISYGNVDLAFEAAVSSPNGDEIGSKLFEAKMPLTERKYPTDYFNYKVKYRLIDAYESISPEFRQFVLETLQKQ